MKVRAFFKRLISGLLIGISAAIPGISGGTVAVILKMYDEIVDSVNHFFKKAKDACAVLVPVVIGVVVALIPCFYLFHLAIQYFFFGLICIFAGLIVGCFPSLTDQIKGQRIKASNIVLLVIAFLISVAIGVISVHFDLKEVMTEVFDNPQWWFYLVVLGIGILASFSLAVPGISGAMILLILGLYDNIVEYFVNFFRNIASVNAGDVGQLLLVILMIIVGIVLGMWGISKLMAIFLKHWHIGTYYAIIGFVLGSIITLFYNSDIVEYYRMWGDGGQGSVPMVAEIIIGISLFIISGVLGYLLINIYRKRLKQNEENRKRLEAMKESQPTKRDNN